MFEKFGGILGPLLFGIALGSSGSSRIAILSVIAFFVVGGGILALVNVGEGEQAARDSDARTQSA